MGKTVRISLKTARAIASHLDTKPWGIPESCGQELRREIAACERKSQKSAPRRKEKTAKTQSKRARTREVRDLVFARAGDFCECGCGRTFGGFDGVKTLDHFEGVARSETVETCWALRWECHRRKTDNSPTREAWLNRFIDHCHAKGYHGTADAAQRELEAQRLLAVARIAAKGAAEAREVAP